MSQFQTREERGIHVHVLPTQMFKKNTIVVTLTQDLQKETATPTALLPYVLMRGSEQHPTPERLQMALDDLYGATLSGSIEKKGERHVIDFTMQVPNEKYLSTDEPLFEKALGILSNVILHPKLENGVFAADHVKAEIDQHRKRIAAVLDDKMAYASMRTIQEMTKGEPYAIPRLGYEEELAKIDGQSLYDLYQRILKTAPIHIYVIGDVDPDQVYQRMFSTFAMERDPITAFREVKIQHEARQPEQVVVDHLDVNQGKLHVGLWANVPMTSDDYPALVVCNGIFGNYPHSKLFVNVREKNSLAYYAVSRLDPFKGILHVMSGVEFRNFDQALSIIKEQLEAMRQGEISDEEIGFTISSLINDYKTAGDSPTTVADMHLNGLIGGRVRSREELIEAFQNVTIDDVVRIAQGIKLDTVYMLRDKGGNAHA
jgi:predicted Zn-dependent peptidase